MGEILFVVISVRDDAFPVGLFDPEFPKLTVERPESSAPISVKT